MIMICGNISMRLAVSILCEQLDLSLNPTKTQEMLFCSKRDKPESATVQLDGVRNLS